MSLLVGDNYTTNTLVNGNEFGCLFNSSKLVDAGKLVMAENTTEKCYFALFQNCYNLTTAPELPATTMASDCYCRMFLSCGRLSIAPALPATTLVGGCYSEMFKSSGLICSPVLPAETLVSWCYNEMFSGCGSLSTVITYAQDISASSCLQSWLDSVYYTGDFYNLGGATYESGGAGIPSGWTEHNSL